MYRFRCVINTGSTHPHVDRHRLVGLVPLKSVEPARHLLVLVDLLHHALGLEHLVFDRPLKRGGGGGGCGTRKGGWVGSGGWHGAGEGWDVNRYNCWVAGRRSQCTARPVQQRRRRRQQQTTGAARPHHRPRLAPHHVKLVGPRCARRHCRHHQQQCGTCRPGRLPHHRRCCGSRWRRAAGTGAGNVPLGRLVTKLCALPGWSQQAGDRLRANERWDAGPPGPTHR